MPVNFAGMNRIMERLLISPQEYGAIDHLFDHHGPDTPIAEEAYGPDGDSWLKPKTLRGDLGDIEKMLQKLHRTVHAQIPLTETAIYDTIAMWAHLCTRLRTRSNDPDKQLIHQDVIKHVVGKVLEDEDDEQVYRRWIPSVVGIALKRLFEGRYGTIHDLRCEFLYEQRVKIGMPTELPTDDPEYIMWVHIKRGNRDDDDGN
jgi:hypothetical protein